MTEKQWYDFFITCSKVLGKGNYLPEKSQTWCSWTTFGRLSQDAGYWTCGLPNIEDIDTYFIKDNGVWMQPFRFSDMAHLIIPKEFFWEKDAPNAYSNGTKKQDISKLVIKLDELDIPYLLSDYCLEIKLF